MFKIKLHVWWETCSFSVKSGIYTVYLYVRIYKVMCIFVSRLRGMCLPLGRKRTKWKAIADYMIYIKKSKANVIWENDWWNNCSITTTKKNPLWSCIEPYRLSSTTLPCRPKHWLNLQPLYRYKPELKFSTKKVELIKMQTCCGNLHALAETFSHYSAF